MNVIFFNFVVILVIMVSLHRANSVTWNPHKMMSVPLQCSALLVREEVGHTHKHTHTHTHTHTHHP